MSDAAAPPPRDRSPARERSRSRSPRRRSRSRSRDGGGGGGGDGGGGGGGKLRGTAARWNDRGFGFIKPEDGSEVCCPGPLYQLLPRVFPFPAAR